MRFVFAALAALLFTGAANAQVERTIRAEANTYTFPGPEEGQPREVFVWRPAGVEGPLPVIYVTDGPGGMMMLMEYLHGPITRGEAPPLMVVALDAEPRIRRREYVPTARRMPYFVAHRDWFLNVVMPWAEHAMGASRDRTQRIIAGASNGGDFAVAMARQRPDLFGAVMAHSPMNPERGGWTGEEAASQRWLVTAPRNLVDADFARVLSRELTQRGAAQRLCIGSWGHDLFSWKQISVGNTYWLLGDEAAAEAMMTDRERQHCSAPG
ncbi:MAG TPA: alpha/beta hydrolase-fold protein [Terricaulis sp.]|nr:alpha/beta hydrolase-fold protein [Terricaulis sp.]